jgi:hypothetical protein
MVINPSPTELLVNWILGLELLLGWASKMPVSFWPMLMMQAGATIAGASSVASIGAVGALPDAVFGVGSLLPEAAGVAVSEDPQATRRAATNRIKTCGQ